jgi:hypothetical protein
MVKCINLYTLAPPHAHTCTPIQVLFFGAALCVVVALLVGNFGPMWALTATAACVYAVSTNERSVVYVKQMLGIRDPPLVRACMCVCERENKCVCVSIMAISHGWTSLVCTWVCVCMCV